MAFRKYKPSGDDANLTPLEFSRKVIEKTSSMKQRMSTSFPFEADVDVDLREIYFLIMHFLSAGPCKRTCGQLWNELLQHQLLPRRYHAWYSRSGAPSGNEDDDGTSLPLCYPKLIERYPHIEKDHLVKLLKQLILSFPSQSPGMFGGGTPNAADVPTLLGSGSFSLLGSDGESEYKKSNRLPNYLRWPHMQADQVRGLSLREIGGGFTKHHRAPSVRAACYAIAKPSTLVKKMEFTKKLRGHQNAVYCATFDRSGRYMITGSDDRLVKIWSMETAFCLASCRGHEGDITDLVVSINNALVASSSNDFIIRVWRLPDGIPISVLRGHIGAVTAIAFSPRLGAAYQLLSSSDDGTCRIWDARNSNIKPRIYVPKPPEAASGRIIDPSSSSLQKKNQILCCAFNANGTVFVTGSSDTFARVWNACKGNSEDLDQPNNEMDLLSGHENDVNYVQFSGCAVASRSSVVDSLKEDNLPKFKNSWFTHDNIVTCSRDGSAIIWIPRSRRSHGKVGRWTRAYHLKVPPPPMPPQPARGGPRQRYQPTPRGVNMIVWSLDNRFVLAAIMDCRICVWNASDGSLVHSLMGHKESTFVLDVHPFNPRIAMSAGYDGKTIIWDIWEGKPVQIYETGPFKLVDGKFSPDGTSIILSDEVGQVYIVTTGQGESQKDAMYDQFFLGDYRPLMQDTHGNTIDQETQLLAHRRNVQDLLCDSSMIPYPEPYQSIYQRRRLGILGVEWRPSSLKLAVGPTFNASTGDYHPLPMVDLEQWIEPLPEILDVDWELENDIQTDDNDSEYNVTEEYSSEEELESLSNSSSGEAECSGQDGIAEHDSIERLRRSKRKKPKFDVEITTSSGRRVKRTNLDERDGTMVFRSHKSKKSKHGPSKRRKKSSESKSLRPQRIAARNARSLLEKITGVFTDGEDYEDEPESSSSESDSSLQDLKAPRFNSKRSTEINQVKHGSASESSRLEHEDVPETSQVLQSRANNLSKRRLVLKLPCRDRNISGPSENASIGCNKNDIFTGSLSTANFNSTGHKEFDAAQCAEEAAMEIVGSKQSDSFYSPKISTEYQENRIKWGEVKIRSSKRLKLGDMAADACPAVDVCSIGPGTVSSDTDKYHKSFLEDGTSSTSRSQIPEIGFNGNKYRRKELDSARLSDTQIQLLSPERKSGDGNKKELVEVAYAEYCHHSVKLGNTETSMPQKGYEAVEDSQNENPARKHINRDVDQLPENAKVGHLRIRIKSVGITSEVTTPASLKSSAPEGGADCEIVLGSVGATNEQMLFANPLEKDEKISRSGILEAGMSRNTGSSIARDPGTDAESNGKMYTAVYKRSKSSNGRKDLVVENFVKEPIESNFHDHDEESKTDLTNGNPHRTRFMSRKASRDEIFSSRNSSGLEQSYCYMGSSRSKGKSILNSHDEYVCDEWKSAIKMSVGLRSARNRRDSYSMESLRPLGKRKDSQTLRKCSWLMLLEQEESCRYIPQKGDEIAYLMQGHEEYLGSFALNETGPWKSIKGLKTVELCKVHALDYSTLPGSGESCCKLTLKFIDPSSVVFGKAFKLTLPELVSDPDFLVERTRFEASIERNWTRRDKCQVWWRNADGNGGSWWEGRIVAVSPKSSDFPDSPWERYTVQYKNETSKSHLHSPWELHDADSQWEHPHINEQIRDRLLASVSDLEDSSLRNKDFYGVHKLNQVAEKSDYLNRYPVPLSLEVIKMRLENNYYRTLEAVEHDASVMLSNAESYFGKSSEMAKLRRLSTWVTDLFLEFQQSNFVGVSDEPASLL